MPRKIEGLGLDPKREEPHWRKSKGIPLDRTMRSHGQMSVVFPRQESEYPMKWLKGDFGGLSRPKFSEFGWSFR